MLSRSPDSLRADLQRYYGLDLDELGHSLRVRRAADLAAHLPDDACVWTALDPRAAWGSTRQLLADIADNTNFLAWCKTKNAQRHGATWKGRIRRPGYDTSHAETTAKPMDEAIALLSRPRT